MPNGGKRPGAGRKRKADEVALLERLSPMDDLFFSAMSRGLKKGDQAFCKMFADYRFGKPVDKVEHSGRNGGAIKTEGKHVVEFVNYAGDIPKV